MSPSISAFFNHHPRRRFLIRLASAEELRQAGLSERASAALIVRSDGERIIDVGPNALLLAEFPSAISEATLAKRRRAAVAAGWQPLGQDAP